MLYKQFNNKIIVRLEKGEELVTSLKTLCTALDIRLGVLFGIGATDKVTIGLLNTKTKKYQTQEFTGDHEITCVMGNITQMNNEPYLHLHVTLADANQNAIGGHLSSAVISATFEGVIELINGSITRTYHEESGLNLLDL
jgi:predicted DNA-binding protein with PD1-like motif